MISHLASYFLEILNEKEGKNITSIEPEVLQACNCTRGRATSANYAMMNRAYILASSTTITVSALPDELKPQNCSGPDSGCWRSYWAYPRGDSEARHRGHVGICFGRYRKPISSWASLQTAHGNRRRE